MEAKYLEISGRTYYAFEEPDFVGPRELWSPARPMEPAEVSLPTIENYRQGFWAGKRFDWLFGVIMPVVCIFFDPAVFTGHFLGEKPWLGAVKPATYALSFVSVLAMMAWLIWGERLRAFSVVFSGLFAMAGLASFLVGLAILPLSLIGLIIFIGIFGFTPFFTAIVMFRNAERSFNAARSFADQGTLTHAFIITLLASAVFPYLIQLAVGR